MEDRVFSDLPEYLKQGDVLVINNSKVIPARLLGQKESGAHIEILLLKQLGVKQWECLVRPGKRLKPGTQVTIGEILTAIVGEYLIDGKRIVDFDYPESMNFFEILDKLGEMPVPPYITRKLENKDDYQTVYAKPLGSAAAPTAGLHFTEELLDKVRGMGVQIAEVTLHVGLGTFRPVKEEDITQHIMHTESYSIDEKNAQIIQSAKEDGRRVICTGTTSCRTVESVYQKHGKICACHEDTSIFIYPGYEFKVMDGLITNFHLPESTLIMLVSAFAGYENTMNAYHHAVEERYRFFSFGDAMLIL
jgi:S-adenosylmethionine:tRNA ribosyltransferase-isomerase